MKVLSFFLLTVALFAGTVTLAVLTWKTGVMLVEMKSTLRQTNDKLDTIEEGIRP